MSLRYTHFFSDGDNTLLKTKQARKHAREALYGYYTLFPHITPEMWVQAIDKAFEETEEFALVSSPEEYNFQRTSTALHKLGLNTHDSAIMKVAENLARVYHSTRLNVEPMEGAIESVAGLYAMGYRTYMVTRSPLSIQMAVVEQVGLRPFIEGIFATERYIKPHREFWLHVLNTTGAKESQSLTLDDTIHNLSTPRNMGLLTIHFDPNGEYSNGYPVKAEPDKRITHLSELLPMLLNL